MYNNILHNTNQELIVFMEAETNNISRRERKKLETKANILRASRRLFEKKGFENTSIEEITEKADVSKGTFFNHFTNKESLLAGIAEEEVDSILSYVEEELKDVTDSLEKIRLIMKRLLEDTIPYLKLTGRLMFSSIINTNGIQSPFLSVSLLLEKIVEKGQKSGEITTAYSACDISTSIFGSYYGITFKWFELGNVPGNLLESDILLDILFQGIKAKP